MSLSSIITNYVPLSKHHPYSIITCLEYSITTAKKTIRRSTQLDFARSIYTHDTTGTWLITRLTKLKQHRSSACLKTRGKKNAFLKSAKATRPVPTPAVPTQPLAATWAQPFDPHTSEIHSRIPTHDTPRQSSILRTGPWRARSHISLLFHFAPRLSSPLPLALATESTVGPLVPLMADSSSYPAEP
jgi:hypothetical protein